MTKLKHRTVEDGRRILSGWEKSGLSQDKFAKQVGISVSVVRYWIGRIRKLRGRKSSPPAVRFVEVVEKENMPRREPTVLQLPGGVSLRTPDLPPAEYVAELSMACQRRFSC